MADILTLSRDDMLSLRVTDCFDDFEPKIFFHIAKQLGVFWEYDYVSAEAGRVGLHAELKSGMHSNVFFDARTLLGYPNILEILTFHLLLKLPQSLKKKTKPAAYVAGVPSGATGLGVEMARMLSAKHLLIEKTENGMVSHVNVGGSAVLLVEDVCTKGTGFLEAVSAVKTVSPQAYIFPIVPVVLNRGGLKKVSKGKSKNSNRFSVISVVNHRMAEWSADNCPLCGNGSKSIKPKAYPENWKLLTESQL